MGLGAVFNGHVNSGGVVMIGFCIETIGDVMFYLGDCREVVADYVQCVRVHGEVREVGVEGGEEVHGGGFWVR